MKKQKKFQWILLFLFFVCCADPTSSFAKKKQASDESFGDPAVESTKISFEKKQIQMGSKKINVEVATSPRQHERGLMFRKKLSRNEGMMFVFERPRILQFWMKNTYIDLDIGYFTANKELIDIIPMNAYSVMTKLPETYPSSSPAQYALEMNQGWFKKNNIKVGEHFLWVKDNAPEKGNKTK